jgi:hypothetical protein
MNDLAQAIRDYASLFERLRISYAFIGGVATRIHGLTRPTFDLDLTIAIQREDLPGLFEAVRDMGYTVPEAYDSGWVDTVGGMPLVKFRQFLRDRGMDTEVFIAETAFQRELISRRQKATTDGIPVWVVSPEDLILLKLIADRKRDRADIEDVQLVQGQLDDTYMRTWADRLGVGAKLEEALRERPKT